MKNRRQHGESDRGDVVGEFCTDGVPSDFFRGHPPGAMFLHIEIARTNLVDFYEVVELSNLARPFLRPLT